MALFLGLLLGFANPFIPESVVLFGFPWPDIPFEIKIDVLTAIGVMYELYVIAAVVVGGTSLSGESGRVLGTLITAKVGLTCDQGSY